MTPQEYATIKRCIALLHIDGSNSKKIVRSILTKLLKDHDKTVEGAE